ncbi:hypothetical protein IKE96_00685 [bacterium]|nr:hypothetical protein [bacterium]
MSKYTITIKNLIDNNFNFQMTHYPIFDENYRNTLNSNILNHYYENEIGFETAPLFRFYLNQRLNEIMPKYNQLYLAQKNLIDNNLLLSNTNLTEGLQGTNSTTSSSTSQSTNSGSSNSKNLFQDTPQGNISSQDIDAQNVYATNITLDHNSTSNSISDSSSATGSGTNSYLKQLQVIMVENITLIYLTILKII